MKKLLVGKVIGFLGICIFAVGISYIVTYYLDKNLYEDINFLVTFEDTKEFTIENAHSREDVLKTYPYIFTVLNQGKKKTDYEIVLSDNNSDRENLQYILFLNDQEVKSGSLNELKKNVLYTAKLGSNKTDTYQLYVYSKEEKDYTYSLLINVN